MFPDYGQWLSQAWGWTPESVSALSAASNIVLGSNPSYSVADFFAMHPKFGGVPSTAAGDFTIGSPLVTNIVTDGLAVGQAVTGIAIPDGAVISSVDSATQFTLSGPAVRTGTFAASVFVAPLLPAAVLNAYIALASASLVQARWMDTWRVGMALYVAHFATLWLRSDGDAYSTPGQAAAAGLAQGITVSASAGPVSESIQPVAGLETWGHWNQTEYGIQFANLAKIIGGGPMLLW